MVLHLWRWHEFDRTLIGCALVTWQRPGDNGPEAAARNSAQRRRSKSLQGTAAALSYGISLQGPVASGVLSHSE